MLPCIFVVIRLCLNKLLKQLKQNKLVVDTAMDYNKKQDFVLEYITDNQQRNETEGRYITNIEHYKKDLSFIHASKN